MSCSTLPQIADEPVPVAVARGLGIGEYATEMRGVSPARELDVDLTGVHVAGATEHGQLPVAAVHDAHYQGLVGALIHNGVADYRVRDPRRVCDVRDAGHAAASNRVEVPLAGVLVQNHLTIDGRTIGEASGDREDRLCARQT